MTKFRISQGDLPKIVDALSDADGAVDLTDYAVAFRFQCGATSYDRTAAVVDESAGTVEYQMVAGETDVAGLYQAQWRLTKTGVVRTFPVCPFEFEIVPVVPVTPPTEFTKLAQLYDDVRAVCGDFKKRLYEDSNLAAVLKTQLRLGRVKDGTTTWKLTPDQLGITPAITEADTQAYALLIHHTAQTLLLPNMADYSYRTRALSERFGAQTDFFFNLQAMIYELEDGGQAYGTTVSALRTHLFVIGGRWVWDCV